MLMILTLNLMPILPRTQRRSADGMMQMPAGDARAGDETTPPEQSFGLDLEWQRSR